MLHVGLDLSRKRVDVCLISDQGELIDQFPAPADRDGLYGLTRRVAIYDQPVRGVVESMNGARFVHDELVAHGWEVLIADAQRVKGLAPLACKTDKSKLCEPILHVEVEPVARDHPVLNRRDVALACTHALAGRRNSLAVRPRHRTGVRTTK